MSSRQVLLLILVVDAFILFFQTSQISISYKEASLLYDSSSFLSILINSSLKLFGENDFALRIVMIVFHLLSAILMYLLSEKYITQDRNRVWLVLVFILLPGNVSAAIVVNNAGLVIFGLLLFAYLSDKIPEIMLNILLFFYSIIDISFAYLFLGLALYYIHEKKLYSFLYMIGLYLLTSYLYGFKIAGVPTGHFLDAIGVYSAIFTPIIFIYLVYALYRRYLTSKVDILWYISTTALLLSLALSFRQRVALEYFAPYLMLAFPLVAQSFISSYRVRLRMFRTSYRLAFIFSFILLVLNTLVVFFNKELYIVLENPKRHFAYDMHVAKELSDILKARGIECVSTDKEMQKRLRFYHIQQCREYRLESWDLNTKEPTNVTVSYKKHLVYKANVTKINTI